MYSAGSRGGFLPCRQYCDDLLEQTKALEASTPEQLSAKAKLILSAFNRFAKKIANHSDFEDTQLFKYFEDHHTTIDFTLL